MKSSISFKQLWLVLFILVTIGCTTPTTPPKPLSQAEVAVGPTKTITWNTHNSSMGFSIDLPSHYLIISREELKENPDLFENRLDVVLKLVKTADKKMVELMKIAVLSESYEEYISQYYRGVNINVSKDFGRIPQTHKWGLTK